MSTVQTIIRLSAVLIATVLALPAAALELASYKDKLFGYPGILSQADGGAFLTIDYQKKRDLFGRDEIPQRRVKGEYLSLGVTWSQHFEILENAGRKIDVFRAGKLKSAKFALIFVHGRGGDRKLGANDYTFGGNFNRLKNLAVDNDGVYYAPSAKDFEDQGTGDVIALIDLIHQTNPGAKIVLSCASMGTLICWRITQDIATVSQLSGMMIMAGVPNPDFIKSAAHAAKLPMFFSHGSDDPVYAAADQIKLYKALFAEQYPTRFVLFQTGNHGTPIRMTDWRDTLNWFVNISR
jgi:triacylglycerol esterase/lipase EstA (alpha/beta hydrolase family)